jgi:hypothetical protein
MTPQKTRGEAQREAYKMNILKSAIFPDGTADYSLDPVAMKGIFKVGAIASTSDYCEQTDCFYLQCDQETKETALIAMENAEGSVISWIGCMAKLLAIADQDELGDGEIKSTICAIASMAEFLQEIHKARSDLHASSIDEIEELKEGGSAS